MCNRMLGPSVALLAFALGGRLSAQNNDGFWEPAFTHAVPMDWIQPNPGWDGEQQGPGRLFMAGHMALIPVGVHRGKVLAWNWMRNPQGDPLPGNPPLGIQHWSIIDVSSPTFLNFDLVIDPQTPCVPPPAEPPCTSVGDLFCSGHAWTRAGHLLVAGGDRYVPEMGEWKLKGNKLVYRFAPTDPVPPDGNLNSWWHREPDLAVNRWYPTVTTLSTDAAGKDILIVAGGFELDGPPAGDLAVNSYEAFDPTQAPGSGTWQTLPVGGGQVFPGPGLSCPSTELLGLGIYPRLFLLTSGKLFSAGFARRWSRLDHTGQMNLGLNPTWELESPSSNVLHEYASSFLYPNIGGPNGGMQDIVYRLGGERRVYSDCTNYTSQGAQRVTESITAGVPAPAWVSEDDMGFDRLFPNAVLLPDGSVVVVSADKPGAGSMPVLQAEIYNDDPSFPNTWRTVAASTVKRGYHSTAVLLPDARVLVGGGEKREQDYEIFQPPYLTNGTQRPQIQNPPATLNMKYNFFYTLSYAPMTGGVTVDRVALMAPGSITHHTDMHQRYVELQKLSSTSTSITFKAPATSKHAPRGYYMLFLVTGVQAPFNRAPSNALWVNLQPSHPPMQ